MDGCQPSNKDELLVFWRKQRHKVSNRNVKDWCRACQGTSKLTLKIRVILPDIDFWTLLYLLSCVLCFIQGLTTSCYFLQVNAPMGYVSFGKKQRKKSFLAVTRSSKYIILLKDRPINNKICVLFIVPSGLFVSFFPQHCMMQVNLAPFYAQVEQPYNCQCNPVDK